MTAVEKQDYKILKDHIATSGRRKTATARLFLNKGKGTFLVNNVDIEEYFSTEKEKLAWMYPFHLIGVSHPLSKFNATIKVAGSGKSAQLGAIVLAFSKALATMSEENQQILRRNGFLTRDSRMVERKKYWFKKARKKPQFSKR